MLRIGMCGVLILSLSILPRGADVDSNRHHSWACSTSPSHIFMLSRSHRPPALLRTTERERSWHHPLELSLFHHIISKDLLDSFGTPKLGLLNLFRQSAGPISAPTQLWHERTFMPHEYPEPALEQCLRWSSFNGVCLVHGVLLRWCCTAC